jgi:hypothetical protein
VKKPSSRRALLAARITTMFIRGDGERYRLAPADLARVESLVEAAADSERAADELGSMLKLIHVLETKRASPTLAFELLAILRASKRARAIIRLHWSKPRKTRAGDVLRAPHFNDDAPAASIKVATFLVARRRIA